MESPIPTNDLDTKPQTHQPVTQNWREVLRERRKSGIARASHRSILPNQQGTDPATRFQTIANRALTILFPWRDREYPGRRRLMAWMLGYPDNATGWETASKHTSRSLPPERAKIAVDNLERLILALEIIVRELREYIATHPRQRRGKVAAVIPPVPPPSE